MARVKTYTTWDGVTTPRPASTLVAPGELNAMQDSYESSFAAWRPLFQGANDDNAVAGATVSGIIPYSLFTLGQRVQVVLTSNGQEACWWFDPADFAAAPRALRLQLRTGLACNQTVPGVTYAFALNPVASVGGGGSSSIAVTAGAAVTGSSTGPVSVAAANTYTAGPTMDFAAPATAGWYVVTVTRSGTPTTGSVPRAFATVSYRLV